MPLVDDPATVTLSNSSTKESLEPSPEHDLGGGATGNVSDAIAGGHQKNAPRRYGSDVGDNIESIYNNSSSGGKNEENGYSNIDGSGNDAASGNLKTDKSSEYDAEIGGKAQAKIRSDSFSNNNVNSTRTLTQQSSLVAPSEVQISVNPALTAEPVFTPTGKYLNDYLQLHIQLSPSDWKLMSNFSLPLHLHHDRTFATFGRINTKHIG